MGLEKFTYYKALWNYRNINITEKEDEDFFFFLNLLNKDSNILDIGANVGIMTTLLAKKAVIGKVFSFEPIPVTFRVLSKMINHYKPGNVKLYNLAVGSENKNVNMNMPIFNGRVSDAGSYVMQDHYYFDNPNVIKVDVEQISIDGFPDLEGVNINAIKIDIENYEYHAFLGARRLLMEQRPIIYSELWFGSKNQIEVFNLMNEVGYTVLIYNEKKLVQFDPDIHKKLNYFFIPDEKVKSLTGTMDVS